ncbi:MAG: aminoglycoside phosphotransferase family protein [Gammaproteobacteria bacterium]
MEAECGDRNISNRGELLKHWLQNVLATDCADLTPASSDASFRRYWRVSHQGESLIVMDAPPEKEDCRSYIAIAQRLIAAGLTAPRIVGRDVEHGFLLLTDLGNRIYLQELNGDKVARLYGDAINAILAMQARVKGHGLPAYGREMLMREMELFREWLLRWHLGISLTLNEHDMLTDSFGLLADAALSQPQAFVHRDYHSRNLMVIGSNNPGILDFQDAVIGPVSYDLVSLLRDCYICWPRAQVIAWATRYFEQAVESGVLGALNLATFLRCFDWMGIQRHLMAGGIFARLWHRDEKNGYLKDIPRTLGYITEVSAEYPELQGLHDFILQVVLPALHKRTGSSFAAALSGSVIFRFVFRR